MMPPMMGHGKMTPVGAPMMPPTSQPMMPMQPKPEPSVSKKCTS